MAILLALVGYGFVQLQLPRGWLGFYLELIRCMLSDNGGVGVMVSRLKPGLKGVIAIAILGALVSFVSLTSYLLRYSQHDGKLGLIPYDEYLELTRMTAMERYFLIAGSVVFVMAAVFALYLYFRNRGHSS